MPSKIGKMRHRITFQERTETQDSFNGIEYSFANLSANPTMWGRVEPINTAEKFTRDNLETRYDYKVTTRWRTDISTDMRIQWTDRSGTVRTLSIVTPPRDIQDERGRYMEFMCLEGGKD